MTATGLKAAFVVPCLCPRFPRKRHLHSSRQGLWLLLKRVNWWSWSFFTLRKTEVSVSVYCSDCGADFSTFQEKQRRYTHASALSLNYTSVGVLSCWQDVTLNINAIYIFCLRPDSQFCELCITMCVYDVFSFYETSIMWQRRLSTR